MKLQAIWCLYLTKKLRLMTGDMNMQLKHRLYIYLVDALRRVQSSRFWYEGR
jgi:hypothetical protein